MMIMSQVGEDTAGVYRCMPDNISPAIINIDIIRSKEEQMAVTNTGHKMQNFEFISLLGVMLIISKLR